MMIEWNAEIKLSRINKNAETISEKMPQQFTVEDGDNLWWFFSYISLLN